MEKQAKCWDLPGDPVLKNMSCNAGDTGSVPGQKTKFPHAVEQFSPHATTAESVHSGGHVPCLGRLCTPVKAPAGPSEDLTHHN